MYTIYTTETLHHFTMYTLFGKPNAPSFSFGKLIACPNYVYRQSSDNRGKDLAGCLSLNFLLQRQMRISANKVCDL